MTSVVKRAGALVRRGLIQGLTLGPVATAWWPFLGARSTVFMFHRFGGPGLRAGDSDRLLRRILRYLRKRRYQLLDLEDLIRRGMSQGQMPRRAVAITFDDGYLEHFEVALPILAEFDAPATFFLTTGFTDGDLWLWWDQVEHLISTTDCPRLALELGGTVLEYDLTILSGRESAIRDFTDRCKLVPNAERLLGIERLAAKLGAEVPRDPPSKYRPMTWEQARIAEHFDIRFGPSTVSHPVLSRADDATALYEIEYSWKRVCEEVTRPVPVFCYPNGLLTDFGEREVRILVQVGLLGAVTAVPAYVAPHALQTTAPGPFAVPRFTSQGSLAQSIRVVSGLHVVLSALSG